MKIFLLCTLIISLIIILYFLSKTEKPIKNAFLSILISWVLWAIINNSTFLTGFYIPINLFTLISCSVYGIPGISGLLALNYIFTL